MNNQLAPMSNGHALDISPDTWGELRDSSAIAFDGAALRERIARDGYLFLPGLLDRAEVLDARAVVLRYLAENGQLQAGTDPLEALSAPDFHGLFRGLSLGEVAAENQPLINVLYDGAMIAFYERLLGGEVRHFDFTWMRHAAPGGATAPHTDAVYMNRGTQNLYTSWTPLGDISEEMGGLMVLENSHQHDKLRRHYSSKDVDAFCENKVGPDYTQMGGGGNIRAGGSLALNPVKLREALGGRWLSAPFRAGDLLVFSIFTVHASLDNHSPFVRLSSDSRYQLASEVADPRWIGPNPIAHGPGAKRAMIC